MTLIKTKDIKFGLQNEKEILILLKTKFKNIEKSSLQYSRYDFCSDTTLIELKTRRNTKDKYPTTMIGMNKIKYFLKQKEKKCYAFFSFTDGLYYVEINEELVKKCESKDGGRCDRGYIETRPYLFIPVGFLNSYHTLENHTD